MEENLLLAYVCLIHMYGGGKVSGFHVDHLSLTHNSSNNEKCHRLQTRYAMFPLAVFKKSLGLEFSPRRVATISARSLGETEEFGRRNCSCGDSCCIMAFCQDLLSSQASAHVIIFTTTISLHDSWRASPT